MGAHLKYRTIMDQLEEIGIQVAILKQGNNRWKVVVGGNHKTFRHRITCNRYIVRIHRREFKQPVLLA